VNAIERSEFSESGILPTCTRVFALLVALIAIGTIVGCARESNRVWEPESVYQCPMDGAVRSTQGPCPTCGMALDYRHAQAPKVEKKEEPAKNADGHSHKH